MQKFAALALVLSALAAAAPALAQPCVTRVTRTACPGKEKESYAKCNGLASCESAVDAADESACAAVALKGCENQRFDITKYKAVTARFAGRDVANGKDFCDQDAGAYVVKKNFPHRNDQDCR